MSVLLLDIITILVLVAIIAYFIVVNPSFFGDIGTALKIIKPVK